MPFRSPKMYFCIFGFHRLVWWPKCTPASSSSFIVSVAMSPPPVSLRSRAARPRRGSALLRRQRRWRPKLEIVRVDDCSFVSGRVLAVDSNVLLREVARPHVILTSAQSEVDVDRVLVLAHHLADLVEPGACFRGSSFDQHFVADGDRHAVTHQARRGLAEPHQSP